jgi:hypothetical protein
MNKKIVYLIILKIVLVLIWAISWAANFVKLINCDFEGPWKEEIVHAIGVVIPVASLVTVWY